MARKLRIAKLEDADEADRALYVDDGKGAFILDVEDAGKLAEFRETNRSYAAQIEAWKALGMTPDQAKAAIADARKKADESLSAADLQKKFEAQLAERETAWQKRERELASKLDRYEILEPLRQSAIAKGAIPADVEDLLEAPSVKRRYRKGENGRLEFLDDQGDPVLGLTADKFFENLAKEKPRFFQPVGAGGSSTKPNETKPADPAARQVSKESEATLEELATGKAVVVAG